MKGEFFCRDLNYTSSRTALWFSSETLHRVTYRSLRIRIGVHSYCRNIWNVDKVHKVPLTKWLLSKNE